MIVAKPPIAPRGASSTPSPVPSAAQLKPTRANLVKSEQIPVAANPTVAQLRRSDQTPAVSSPTPPEPVEHVEKATVTFEYTAAGETEISLVVGDVVVILEKNDSGWWKGEAPDGSSGWFPSDFVEVCFAIIVLMIYMIMW